MASLSYYWGFTPGSPLHCDNQAATMIASDYVLHDERTKHIEFYIHFPSRRRFSLASSCPFLFDFLLSWPTCLPNLWALQFFDPLQAGLYLHLRSGGV